jgi:hypothetical protein
MNMNDRYFPPGVIGPQVDTPQPRGGIGIPVHPVFRRQPWQSPAGEGVPHNLPPQGDRLARRALNPIGGSGMPGGPGTGLPGGSALFDYTRTLMVRERHRYAYVIETPLPVGVTSVPVLNQPTGLRNFLILRNISTGAQVIFVSMGNQATLNSPLRLGSNQAILFDTVVPQNELNAISDLANGTLMVAYSQYAPLS